ncbi:mitogen-activated protein kinase kinase kinase 20-like [Malania oleifera]|uniref:mitogen-activated protein kinase kinase kinase 20-like n=1 Tax=Malania oleifera TaxID=397392 RepID=UPI0025AEAE56|nr:mitogen-activated protein kinase kinase kinase 20-like [Malania oleifera]
MERKRGGSDECDYGDGGSWSRGPLIAKGSFGSVFIAIWKKKKKKGYFLAVKSCEVSTSSSLRDEGNILSNFHGCSNILQCFGEETTTSENGQVVYNLLLEYASGGTLGGLIAKNAAAASFIPESDVRAYTRDILCGLHQIHVAGYVHCDLKPENILLFPPDSGFGRFVAKIADFGLAKKRRVQYPYLRGSAMYLSPEVLIDGIQGAPSDIWALGCVVLKMLTGRPPWLNTAGLNREGLLSRIATPNELQQIPSSLSEEAKDFLKHCFVRKANTRFTAEMLLIHPFVAGLDCTNVQETSDFEEQEQITP